MMFFCSHFSIVQTFLLFILILVTFPVYLNSFNNIRRINKPTKMITCRSSGIYMQSLKPSLDGPTLWRLGINFRQTGHKETNAIMRIRFVQTKGYEPPQGRVFIEDDLNSLVAFDEKGYSGTWMLSEDKNDRKDGLWIWGIFEEPKYPFLYFNLNVYNSTILPSGEEEPIFGEQGIPGNRLYFRFNHIFEKEIGVTLSSGEVTYKLTEYVKADPFGIGGKVNVGDEIKAGIVDIRPVREKEREELNRLNANNSSTSVDVASDNSGNDNDKASNILSN